MRKPGYIIAHTGAHGTGKTTAVYRHAAELKVLNPHKTIHVLAEVARTCPYSINKKTSEAAQLWIFSKQINTELSLMNMCDIVLADRSAVDAVAYTIAAGFDALACDMVGILHQHIHNYKKIIFHKITSNEFCCHDGIRDSEDREFRETIEIELLELYKNLFPLSREEEVFSFV